MTQTLTLEQLQDRLGKEAFISRWFEIDQARIDKFADVTEDHQFIHVDPERVKRETPFDNTIAHGFLTMSLLPAMSYECLPEIVGTKMLLNYGMNRLRFISPVPTGSRVRGHFVLSEASENRPGEATLVWVVTIEVEGQEKPAMVAEWVGRQYFEREMA